MKKRAIEEVLGDGDLGKRAAEARSKLKIMASVVSRENGTITKIVCRLCGTVIFDSVAVSETTFQDDRGRTIVERVVKPMPLGSYRMVSLGLSNGGQFTTNMCADCAEAFDATSESATEALFMNGIDEDCHIAVSMGFPSEKIRETIETTRAGLRVVPGKKRLVLPGGSAS